MDYEILQVLPISRDILLVIYAQDGRKKPAFVLKDCFSAWLYFWIAPESYEAANALLCGRKEH